MHRSIGRVSGLLIAPNISGIQEDALVPPVGLSKRNPEPEEVISATSIISFAAMRGQRDTSKGKDVPM